MNQFKHFPVRGTLLLCCTLLSIPVASAMERGRDGNMNESRISAPNSSKGLYVSRRGVLMHDGHPFRGIGVNYFDAFSRNNDSYLTGFAYLHSQGIPYIRFMAEPGFWPNDIKQYLANPQAYFQRMDAFVHNAEVSGIGLIPSLFWNSVGISDALGEPRDQWANASSKTRTFMRNFTQQFVTRYKNSPAIWAWEFTNEFNTCDMDRLNPERYRPVINVAEGTPAYRTAADDLTTDQLKVAAADFANTVRLYDPERLILSGNNIADFNQYNRYMLHSYADTDTPDQFGSLLDAQNPSPINSLTMHIYPEDKVSRYFTSGGSTSYSDVISAAMGVSKSLHKPLDIEEFGAYGTDEQANFEAILSAIVNNKVPLSSLWVYDFSYQDSSWNVTQSNTRAYQLNDIIKANKAIRAELGN